MVNAFDGIYTPLARQRLLPSFDSHPATHNTTRHLTTLHPTPHRAITRIAAPITPYHTASRNTTRRAAKPLGVSVRHLTIQHFAVLNDALKGCKDIDGLRLGFVGAEDFVQGNR